MKPEWYVNEDEGRKKDYGTGECLESDSGDVSALMAAVVAADADTVQAVIASESFHKMRKRLGLNKLTRMAAACVAQ